MIIQPVTVQEFWKYMQGEYHSKVVAKNDSDFMELAGGVLELLKIQDKQTFMTRFTTTIGRTVYIPFEIGVENAYYDLWGQIRVCVHEHEHIVQGDRDGWIVFDGKYVASTTSRATYEAEAYGCDMEMEFWHRGPTFDLVQFGNDRAEGLRNYGCPAAAIEMAKQILTIRAGIVSQGVVETNSAQRAIAWLEKNRPELKAA
jgi:hypothetical protein